MILITVYFEGQMTGAGASCIFSISFCRHHTVMALITYLKTDREFFISVATHIAYEYTGKDGNPGPFSMVGYLRYVL